MSSVSIVHRGLMEVRRGEYSIYYGLELGSKRVSSWRDKPYKIRRLCNDI